MTEIELGYDIRSIEPRSLWRRFDDITKIPRPSNKEGLVRAYLYQWADGHGYKHTTDSFGNVVVSVPASLGYEQKPPLAVQAHMDMVTVAAQDVAFDFAHEPIQTERAGDWVQSRERKTTLGADNGIGLSACMALAEADIPHPPLELIFTAAEESGLEGAKAIDPKMVTASTILNLDSEEGLEFVTVASAAARRVEITFPAMNEDIEATGKSILELSLGGMIGGHSGIDIDKNHGNAIVLMATVLKEIMVAFPGMRIASIAGGDAGNAIPKGSSAKIVLDQADVEDFNRFIDNHFTPDNLKRTISRGTPTLTLKYLPTNTTESSIRVINEVTLSKLLSLLTTVPDGVQAMSSQHPDVVETSVNLALLKTHNGENPSCPESISLLVSVRSSREDKLAETTSNILATTQALGATAEEKISYGPWNANEDSNAVRAVRDSIRAVLGIEPKDLRYHAGLELGVLAKVLPVGRTDPNLEIDCVSFGPLIRDAHKSTESVSITSVEQFWRVLLASVTRIADLT